MNYRPASWTVSLRKVRFLACFIRRASSTVFASVKIKSRVRNLFSTTLILLGIFCLFLAGYYFWQRGDPQRLAFKLNENLASGQSRTGDPKPTQLIIKDVNINLAVFPATIKNNKWEATTEGVSYLSSSPLPGEEGNSILYGHNWSGLLGSLVKAKPGQEIQVAFDNSTQRTFRIEYMLIVNPTETYVLKQTRDRRITLYTCTGFLDRKRFVVVAILKEI